MPPLQKTPVQHLPDPAICRAKAGVPNYPECLVDDPAHCDYSLGFGGIYFCRHPQRQEIVAKTVAGTKPRQQGIH